MYTWQDFFCSTLCPVKFQIPILYGNAYTIQFDCCLFYILSSDNASYTNLIRYCKLAHLRHKPRGHAYVEFLLQEFNTFLRLSPCQNYDKQKSLMPNLTGRAGHLRYFSLFSMIKMSLSYFFLQCDFDWG